MSYTLTANSLPVTIPAVSASGTAEDFGAAMATALNSASLKATSALPPTGCLICNDTVEAIFLRSEADKSDSGEGIRVGPGQNVWIPGLLTDIGPDLWYETDSAFRAVVTY